MSEYAGTTTTTSASVTPDEMDVSFVILRERVGGGCTATLGNERSIYCRFVPVLVTSAMSRG